MDRWRKSQWDQLRCGKGSVWNRLFSTVERRFTIRAVKAVHLVGAQIAGMLSAWASFSFLRGSLTGAPPMYSRGWFKRALHFIAGIIFAALAVAAVFMLAGKW